MSDFMRSSVIRDNAQPRTNVDQGLRKYLLNVYNYMALGLALTGMISVAVASSPNLLYAIYNSPLQWIVMLLPVGLAIFITARLDHLKASTAQMLFWVFAAAMGLSLSWIFLAYTGVSVAKVFFISAGTFAATSMYGYVTKTDLSRFGSFLFMGLIGLIIASVVNLFMRSSGFSYMISFVGVLLFVAMTAYDTQRIKSFYYATDSYEVATKKSILGALTLYMDFINLFVYMLRFLGDRR